MSIIDHLSNSLNISPIRTCLFLKSAANKYKVYRIPKRNFGYRVIAQPSRELKKYQRKFIKILQLPCHKSAIGYRKGFSIKDNAAPHSSSKYLLKLDLENFFLKITPEIFWSECQKNYLLDLLDLKCDEKQLINQLLFWCPSKKQNGKLVLSIGAPSSPMVSNFTMFSFDENINNYCLNHNITYTRYADDLSFSSNDRSQLEILIVVVQRELQLQFQGAHRLNLNKTVLLSKGHNRHITGITLTNDGKLSLGRNRKKMIKSLVYKFLFGELSEKEISKLNGWLAYVQSIEPAFLKSLRCKYGLDIIEKIRASAK